MNAAEALRAAIEENYDFTQLVAVVAMMEDKQVEEYLGVLEPIVSELIVTENSWTDRVMPADKLAEIARGVFGPERVTLHSVAAGCDSGGGEPRGCRR